MVKITDPYTGLHFAIGEGGLAMAYITAYGDSVGVSLFDIANWDDEEYFTVSIIRHRIVMTLGWPTHKRIA